MMWIVFNYIFLETGLFVLARNDQKTGKIPNNIIGCMLVARTILLLLESFFLEKNMIALCCASFMEGALASGLFLVLYVSKPGMLGAGDVKLMWVLGYFLGLDEFLQTIFLSVWLAAVINVWKLRKKEQEWGVCIPLTPYIFAGNLLQLVLLAGKRLWMSGL